MSNTTKNLKKRLKAPRELVSAAKRGERVTLRRRIDTRATHIRRFSKAFAVYACAAALLVGGVSLLPSLMDGSSDAPLSQPSGDGVGQNPSASSQPIKPAAADGYVSLSADQAATYIRPDLIWANELNPQLKDTVIWSAQVIDGESSVTHALTLPAVGGEDAEYALEFRMESIDNAAQSTSLTYMARKMAQIKGELLADGFEEVNIKPVDGEGKSSFYAVTRDELSALDTDKLLSELNSTDRNLRFVLRIAWQSLDGSQIPDPDSFEWNGSDMDLSAFALEKYVYTDKEDYVRPDLIWANEDNLNCAFMLFSAERWSDGTEDYALLENTDNISGYTFAVDVQLRFILEPVSEVEGNEWMVTGSDEAKLVEKVLGWKPIVAGESYEATCEQLMALNDADIVPAFARAYEELYGIDADSIPTISVLFAVAWQSVE